MKLVRDPYGHYAHTIHSRLLDTPRRFFMGHEATKDAVERMYISRPRPGDGEPEERADFQYDQTRGGRFKIPEPRYYAEKRDTQGKAYKTTVARENVQRFAGTDDDLQIEAGPIYGHGQLVPCTYTIG